MRLIDADKLIWWLEDSMKCSALKDDVALAYSVIKKKVEGMPTIDPVKHGRWKIERESSGVRLMVCDCGYRFPAVLGLYCFKFCPNCGAKMD